MAAGNEVQIRWDGFEADDPDAARAVELLKREGGEASVEAPGEPGIVFIPIILGAIAVVGLAKAVKSFIDDTHVGVLIDTRETPVTVTKQKLLPRGVVVSIDKDGKVTIEQPDHESLADLIKGVAGAK